MATIQAPDLVQNVQRPLDAPEIAPQCNLSAHARIAPVYKYVQQFQSNNGANVTLNNTSPAQSTWNISGDDIYNLAQSYMTFDLALTASANVTVVHTDVCPIDSIYLRTSGGTDLVQLSNVQSYVKNMAAMVTPMDDYLCRGPVYGGTTVAANLQGENALCNPSNSLAYTAATTTSTSSQYYYSASGAGATVLISTVAGDGNDADSGTDKSMIGKQRLVAAGAAGGSVAMALRYRIPFKYFAGSLFAVDKDLLLGQNFQIIINWSAVNKFVLTGDAFPLTGTIVAYAGAGSISSCYLWLAKECNSTICDDLRGQLRNGGIQMLIPWTQCGRGSTGAAGRWSYNNVIQPGSGLALKRVVNVLVNSTEINALSQNNNNVNAAKYTEIQSQLNADYLQPQPVLAGTNTQDYWLMRKMLRNTPAGQSVREFQINSVWVDNFSDNVLSSADWQEDDCKDSGLHIDPSGKNYIITYNVAASDGAALYQYTTFVRRLIINPMGLSWGA